MDVNDFLTVCDTNSTLTKTYETNKFGDTKLFEKKTNNQTKNNT